MVEQDVPAQENGMQEQEAESALEKKEKKGWAAFVESDVADFFYGFELEKMTLEDGNGNKAKLSRTKDCGIKIEYTSTITL